MTSSVQSRAVARPNAQACVACRERHLRCDGTQPVCTRCVQYDVECIYVESRRGKRPRRSDTTPSRTTQTEDQQLPATPAFYQPAPNGIASTAAQGRRLEQAQYLTPSTTDESISSTGADRRAALPEHLIDAFYQYVHPAHPFVVPHKVYLREPALLPTCLRHVMCFMASHTSSEKIDAPRLDFLLRNDVEESGFRVQALLLFAIDSFARLERETGARALMEAQSLADSIAMYSNDFRPAHSPTMRESWRRTWWELYNVSSLISLVSGVNMRIPLYEDLALPGHCDAYNMDRTSEQLGEDLTAMRHRFMSEQTSVFSSFAYRVEAARILNVVLKNETLDQQSGTAESRARMSNAMISGYLLSLPKDKRNATGTNGKTDEVMSCALMIINLASICLHFPRSGIFHNGSLRTICGSDRSKVDGPGIIDTEMHRRAALRSADELSCLISSRQDLGALTPCFSCAISFAAAVHLSAHVAENTFETMYKEHVNLELMALTDIGRTWPIAKVVRSQIAQFARQVVQIRPSAVILQPTHTHYVPPLATPAASHLDEQWLQDLVSMPIEFPVTDFYFSVA